MDRRDFLKGATAAAALTMVPNAIARAASPAPAPDRPGAPKPFKLRYAFDAGQFSNSAPGGVIEELKFAHDQGFTAMEDNRMKGRPVAEQEAIAREMSRLGMTMGIILNNGTTGFKANGSLSTGKPEETEAFLAEVRSSIECAKRVNAKWMTSLVGMMDPKLPRGYQIANVIDNVRRACELLEPHGLVMVFEPLNVTENHPGFLIHSNDELYMFVKAVKSPSCKILYDLYHSQINEGHLIYNFDKCFDEVAYIQTGDTPGRKEPGTGEVNYRNVFKFIYDRGYTGLLGMEHGKSLPGKEGELALIQAYREADDFVPAVK
jgi:hydroxypyruvate isomerase